MSINRREIDRLQQRIRRFKKRHYQWIEKRDKYALWLALEGNTDSARLMHDKLYAWEISSTARQLEESITVLKKLRGGA